MQNLKELILRLNEAGCRFVVVGGFGAVSFGSSLVTRDVDVACDLSPENLLRVWQALQGLNPVHRMTPDRLPFTRDQAGRGDWNKLYLTTDLGQLDLLGEVKGIGGFEQCLANSESIPLGGTEIRVLTLDAMIRSKRAMGRPRDLHAALEIEVIRERRSQEDRS
ncbi:MAG: nucleotidyltransferase [Verrucomicrobia bacterium]|jgi:predicted nucleotidyltransferase|nr:nucleotidyltransferase [Verrucomicrobiota bacterium]